jgi:purine-binding chemotaxis protein CheW
MQRAERIRKMREGSRSEQDGDDAEPAADAEAGDDEDVASDTEVEQSAAADVAADSDAESGTTDEDVAESVDDAEETASADGAATDDETLQTVGDVNAAVESGDVGTGFGDVTKEPTTEADAGEADDEPTTDAPAGVETDADTTTTRTETRVLEFTLGDEQYCLDIEYIEEIVKRETITRVPNTPAFVEGVVDLRGQITTILNPKEVIGIEEEGSEQLIVVFDDDEFDEQGNIGWLVDEVKQVTPIVEDEVNESPMEREYINGIIDRDEDEEFVIWTSPDLALDEASS